MAEPSLARPVAVLFDAAPFDATAAAPAPRTLIDVLDATARQFPEAAALDDGRHRLDYASLRAEVTAMAERLGDLGVGRGDRVGVRIPSGTVDLYLAILGVLAAGAAYVPVDADDPDERAALVFGEAGVRAVITADLKIEEMLTLTESAVAVSEETDTEHAAVRAQTHTQTHTQASSQPPTPDDDAWIIFTSGSTGKPKGVAVTHRSAAAFVDAEARLFLRAAPIGPGDRVLAGLSVAFDASCEEMWLAWRHGACLVPAPRALVRSGIDLGPWLVDNGITVVSTVPTLASLWPVEALNDIRLLIFGGESCPPELVERLAVGEREVWNTYGPTEATVVATAALLRGGEPVRIGLPLDGWAVTVVDPRGLPVAPGESGELVIGGVGLARYLDPVKDAEKYAPLPSAGWERAYRSGDLVRAEPAGLVFLGRADEQVKLGGRRIELGEVDAALQAAPGVAGAAAAVKGAAGGNQVLVGYVVPLVPTSFDPAAVREQLARTLPAALIPRIAVVAELPTRTSGKVDRDALPWPLPGGSQPGSAGPGGLTGSSRAPGGSSSGSPGGSSGTVTEPPKPFSAAEQRLAESWAEILGEQPPIRETDFFDVGGGSLAAARLVSVLRAEHPTVTVRDVYDTPTLGGLAARLDLLPRKAATPVPTAADVQPLPLRSQTIQTLLMIPLATIGAIRWLTMLAALGNLLDARWVPHVSWWWVAAGFLVFVTPLGRIGLAATGARLLLRGVGPGEYPRGGSVHLRVWTAERFVERVGALTVATGPWNALYARALGADIGADVDLHSPPPVTGLLRVAQWAAIEPEVDLSGHWIDGGLLRIGEMRVGAGASIGARSTLLPGVRVGRNARVAPGSSVGADVPDGQAWAGSPAGREGRADKPVGRPRRSRFWSTAYTTTGMALGLLPAVAALAGLVVLSWFVRGTCTPWQAFGWALYGVAPATVVFLAVYAAATLAFVRVLSIGLSAGDHPMHSRKAWQTWTVTQLMSMARVWLYPLYASVATPAWLRLLGMKVGRDVELSTVLAVPTMTTIDDGAFLADDTMIAPYELAGGWMRVGEATIGKRAFVGNSGMVAPGRRLPKESLVGVLSAAPAKAKRGRSYLGMPPERLRRSGQTVDKAVTYDPPRRLKITRAAVELLRLVAAMLTGALALLAAAVLANLADSYGAWFAVALCGLVLLGAGIAAATLTTIAKWALVGRITAGEQPLWSSFVWRNELADNFVELVAAPWFAEPWLGTAPLNAWLRSLGSVIGRGVWCETYWLPEADLIELGDGASVNRGCVVQTHLFHDRVMSMDTVILRAGATLGPHCVILPAATVGAHATIGPASLVMRGETVPDRTRWVGNPIIVWEDEL
jgi:non-ribosomal peptide synthetase-like protein